MQPHPAGGAAAAAIPAATGRPLLPPRVASTVDPVTASDPAPAAPASDALDWFRQWYPVAIEADVDGSRPTAVRLLNKRLVLWKDAGGAWSCLEDRCPHRLAPLSEGRIEPKTGNLMCSYHGWEFDGKGACTAIPQLGDDKTKASAFASKRSCVTSYPVKVVHGLLWVWPDASPDAAAASAAAPMALIEEQDDPEGWEARTGWFMRDVPCSMETVAENVTDPCHAPFTHHGVQGHRENEKGTVIRPCGAPTKAGFLCEQEGTTPRGKFNSTFEFKAPVLIKYKFPIFGRVMAVYIIPSATGWCRMITRFFRSKNAAQPRAGLFGLFLLAMEFVEGNRVLEHALMRNTVLDGDNYILHVQERILLEGGDVTSWQRQYYMPGQFDTGVSSWRSWLDRFGRNLPTMARKLSDLPPEMGRREALDRYSQHTQHCPNCKRALGRIDAALPALFIAGVALLAAAVFSLVTAPAAAPAALGGGAWGSPAAVRALWCAAGAAAAALLHRKLSEFRRLFVFTDYVHAEKN